MKIKLSYIFILSIIFIKQLFAQESEEKGCKEEIICLLDNFCIGPTFTLGLVNLIGFGIQGRFNDMLRAQIDYQFMPSITVFGVSGRWSAITAEGHIHPLKNIFFVLLGFSYEKFTGSISVTLNGETTMLKGSMEKPLIKVGVGITNCSNLMLASDFGIMIPFSKLELFYEYFYNEEEVTKDELEVIIKKYNLDISVDDIEKIESYANKVINFLPVIIQVNIIRVGYLF